MLMYFPFFHFPLSISSRADRKRRGGGALQDGRVKRRQWRLRPPGRVGEAAVSRTGGGSGGVKGGRAKRRRATCACLSSSSCPFSLLFISCQPALSQIRPAVAHGGEQSSRRSSEVGGCREVIEAGVVQPLLPSTMERVTSNRMATVRRKRKHR